MATILKRFQQAVSGDTQGTDQDRTTVAQTKVGEALRLSPKAGSAQILKAGAFPAVSGASTDQNDTIPDSAESTNPPKDAESTPIAKGGLAARLPGNVIGKERTGSNGLVDFNLADLVEQGREQINSCRQEVEAMLEQARVQGETIKKDAKSAGHAEGKKVAAAEIEKRIASEADAKAKAQVESLRKAVLLMRTQYDAWMQQYAEVLTVTAIAAAEKLTRREIQLPNASLLSVPAEPGDTVADPVKSGEDHLLVRWAREALHSTRSAGKLTLAVHPDTLAELGRAFDDLLSNPDLPEQSMVVPDESLTVGDIVVRQDGGEIRAGINAQLERLREELLGDEIRSLGDTP
ncbi:Flagellar biosynthesis/type III secretory pathway protein FliH [Neorhodopirellula lusitana]|uniref:Flagellar assembly protein FliH n=1 Tax=Neorhodopirellula lusitana TaxID=445327 RepID=A0ABY1Q6P0_9BACT|nr:FliH/SctL family protein [Neorhodopirellula lusitana]SMP58955.1 Flagellar biosynthesis/type III secretory pathway protein FliH [Neorhodopirellula lusitana]